MQLRKYYGIALARGFFEFLAIQDARFSAAIVDDSGFLEDASGHGYTRAPGPQHAREQIMGEWQDFHTNPVLSHQEPARQALVHFVQTVAGSDLLGLQRLQIGKAGQQPLPHGKFWQELVQHIRIDSGCVARDLYDYASGRMGNIQENRQPGKALVP